MNPLTKEQLREKILKVMSDWGVDFYEGNLIHREEQRLSIIRGFQDAMINIILEDRKAYAEYVIGEDEEMHEITPSLPNVEMVNMVRENNYLASHNNKLRAEQRQRNQKENKDV